MTFVEVHRRVAPDDAQWKMCKIVGIAALSDVAALTAVHSHTQPELVSSQESEEKKKNTKVTKHSRVLEFLGRVVY